ncbi:MAG: hypothetical protein QW478_01895 [Candidatus Micrarchaeaceae archaeon]
MEIIGIDCLKQIFYFSCHKDLINWRRTCKCFKFIIDNLSFPYDFYTSLEKGYYLVIKKLFNLNHDWNKALLHACKNNNLKIVKLIISKGVTKYKNLIYTAFNYNNFDIATYLISTFNIKRHFLIDLIDIIEEELTNINPNVVKLKVIFDYKLSILSDYIMSIIIYNKVRNVNALKEILKYNTYYNYDLLCRLISVHSKNHNKYDLIKFLLSINTNPECLYLFKQEPYYDVSDILELLFSYGANPNDEKLMTLYLRTYMLNYDTINNIKVLLQYGFNVKIMEELLENLCYSCFDKSVIKYNNLIDSLSKYLPNNVKKISHIKITIKIKKEFLEYVDNNTYEFDTYEKMLSFVRDKFNVFIKNNYLYVDKYIKINDIIIGDVIYERFFI